MATVMQDVHQLRKWDKGSLIAAKNWWLTVGVELVGKRDAWNYVAEIDLALKGK